MGVVEDASWSLYIVVVFFVGLTDVNQIDIRIYSVMKDAAIDLPYYGARGANGGNSS